MIPVLALANWITATFVVAFLFICIFLILTILIQRPQGGGLSGAFGAGSASGQTAFGARTGDALTIGTIVIFVVYLAVAIGLNFAVRPPSATTPVMSAALDTGAEDAGETTPAGAGATAPAPIEDAPGGQTPPPPSPIDEPPADGAPQTPPAEDGGTTTDDGDGSGS